MADVFAYEQAQFFECTYACVELAGRGHKLLHGCAEIILHGLMNIVAELIQVGLGHLLADRVNLEYGAYGTDEGLGLLFLKSLYVVANGDNSLYPVVRFDFK